MKHTIKLLTLAFTLAAILTLTGCPGPVTPDVPCTHEHTRTEVIKEATCKEDGLGKIICVDCEEIIDEQKLLPIDPENHDWVLENEKTHRCYLHNNITASHTFIAGGCDECGAFEHNGEDDYQIMAYVYSSKEDAQDDKNKRVLYFSFPKNTTGIPQIVIGEYGPVITTNDLIQMKNEYIGKIVKYFAFEPQDFTNQIDSFYYENWTSKLEDLDRNSPIYIVVE